MGLCLIKHMVTIWLNQYRVEVRRLSYIRVGKLWSRGRTNSPKISEREFDNFYQQGGMTLVLLKAMLELPGHEDSFLALY